VTTPSGDHYELRTATACGQLRAVIGSVAAGIRHLSIDGTDLVPSIPEQDRAPMGAGIVLVPWPNRIRDGRWTMDGKTQQLAITEPDRNNAIHGLLRYTDYRQIARDDDSVTLGARIYPQPGYPFLLDTVVHYELVSDGLQVTHAIENIGNGEAPVAVGSHPYLKIGGVPTASLTLHLAASSHFEVDDRLLPTGEVPVDGTAFDLRDGRLVGELELDDAFGEVLFDDGETVHSLVADDGRSVSIRAGDAFDYVQVFTTRSFPGEDVAIAIEPMTAPADAFNSGRGVRWLAPGERWEAPWGIRFDGFGGDAE
jgi:aldose 1-epimerase